MYAQTKFDYLELTNNYLSSYISFDLSDMFVKNIS